MILLENNNPMQQQYPIHNAAAAVAAAAYKRQLSNPQTKNSLVRKISAVLSPVHDNNNNIPTPKKVWSRNSSSSVSDFFNSIDLFAELTASDLEDIKLACEELDAQQQQQQENQLKNIHLDYNNLHAPPLPPRQQQQMQLLRRSLSQQQQQQYASSLKLSSLMMNGTMDNIYTPQQALNQQVPYPYTENVVYRQSDAGSSVDAAGSDINSAANGGLLTSESVESLMDFTDNDQNQNDMELFLGGDGSRYPTLAEINALVPSANMCGRASTHSTVMSGSTTNDTTVACDTDGYIFNEYQSAPEYLGPWSTSVQPQQQQPLYNNNAAQYSIAAPYSQVVPLPHHQPSASYQQQQQQQQMPSSNLQTNLDSTTALSPPYYASVQYQAPMHASSISDLLLPNIDAADRQRRLSSKNPSATRINHASGTTTGSSGLLSTSTAPRASLAPAALQKRTRRQQQDDEENIVEAAEDDDEHQNNNQKREWWEYNVNHRGQRLDSVISRMRAKPKSSDPHVLPTKEDPVFDADVANSTKEVLGFSVKHGGKARIGNGNDLTPRPERLRSMKNQLAQLDAKMDALAVTRDDTEKERTRKRREKNRLASRVCRLKRKAQHEANKVMLNGLEKEHQELIAALGKVKDVFRAKLARSLSQPSSTVKAMQDIRQQILSTDCDLRPQAFVNDVIEGRRSTGIQNSTAGRKVNSKRL